MALTDRQKEICTEFKRIAREKGYKEETIEILIMLACCKDMKENYGTAEEALLKIIEFCKNSTTSQESVEKTLDLTGALWRD